MILKCLLWNFSEISCSWIKCSKIIVEWMSHFASNFLSFITIFFLNFDLLFWKGKKLCKFSKIKTQHKCLQNLDLLYLGMNWDLALHKPDLIGFSLSKFSQTDLMLCQSIPNLLLCLSATLCLRACFTRIVWACNHFVALRCLLWVDQ